MMYEGEEVNTIDLLYEKPTTEENGVKVIVPVNYYDKREFYQKIKEQLAYFDSVYFDCAGEVNNNFFIYRNELFQFSELANDSKLHICLDNVYYPIDFQKLGIESIEFPVGVRLGLTDGVFPTPNRESIRYTKESKEIILNKIREISDYFVDKYNEGVKETENFLDIMDFYSNNSRYVTFEKKRQDVSCFEKYATKKFNEPKLKGVSVLDLRLLHKNKDYILKEYSAKYRIESRKWREGKNNYYTEIQFRNLDKRHFIYSDKIPGRKKEYLKELYGGNTSWGNHIYIIKKVKDFTLGKLSRVDYSTYSSILGLGNIQRHLWRTAIQEFQMIVNNITKNMLNIDELVVPQDWVDSRKKVKVSASGTSGGPRKVKLKGEVVGKQAFQLERWVDGKNCKWVSTTYNLENIHKEPCLMVYGKEADVKVMDQLFKIVDFHKCKTKMKFVYFSEREFANLEKVNVHNWITLTEFMKGENKPFKRLVTAYLIEKLYEQYTSVFNAKDHICDISEQLSDKLDTLDKYRMNNCEYANTEVYKAMLEVAEANNAFDQEIYPIYKEVKALCERLSFLEPLCDTLRSYRSDKNDSIVKAIADLFKYYKQRIDWKNYNIKLNDEVVNEPLTEETVDELLEN